MKMEELKINGTITEVLKVESFNLESPKNILFYNHYRNEQHSLILLSK